MDTSRSASRDELAQSIQCKQGQGDKAKLVAGSARKDGDEARHYLIFALVAGNYAQLDMEIILMFFLLSESDLQCDYVPSFSKMKTWQMATLLLWRPLSGYLTDATAHIADWLLFVVCVLETLTLAFLALVPVFATSFNPWVVLGMQIFKRVMEVQMYNSIWKLFKMRLEFRVAVDPGSQCRILSRVGMGGEMTELWWNLISCAAVTLYVSHVANPSVLLAKWWFLASSGVATLMCLVASIGILTQENYFTKPDPSELSGDHPAAALVSKRASDLLPLLSETDSAVETESVEAAALDGAFRQRRVTSLGVPMTRSRIRSQEWPNARAGNHGPRAVWQYCKQSTLEIWNNTVARQTTIHGFLLFWPYTIQGTFVFFAVPGRHEATGVKTPANFCDHYISNTVYQDTMINVVYIVAVTFYLLVLKRIRPVHFFQYLFPIAMVLLLGVGMLLPFKLPGVVQYTALSSLLAFQWMFFLYDTFLATAVISERVYGFYTFINGYVQTIPYIVCFYLMSRKVDAAVMRDISFALMLVVALYSLYFGWGSAAKLRAASGNYC